MRDEYDLRKLCDIERAQNKRFEGFQDYVAFRFIKTVRVK